MPAQHTKPALEKINQATVDFNKAFSDAIPKFLPIVKDIIKDLGWDDVDLMDLRFPGLTYNREWFKHKRAVDGQELIPDIKFKGHPLPLPQIFLNEARLSAFAISLYLAGRLACIPSAKPGSLKLLVLDDVLVGIDQSNRLPVLQVLATRFSDWQIVLLTHDRVWFEMAKFYLQESGKWLTIEMFEHIDPLGNSRPSVRPENTDPIANNIALSRKFLAEKHFPAAAVHTRIAFELSLKKFCSKHRVPVPYHSDPRKLTTEDFLTAVESYLSSKGNAALDPKIKTVKMFRKVVLNPFSHSTPVNLAELEISQATDAVEEMHTGFQALKK